MANNARVIQTSDRGVFMHWLQFLKPYHKLANREMEALAILLYYRNNLAKEISNEDLVDKLLFSPDIRAEVRQDLGGMKSGVFNNMLTVLRRKNALSKDNRIRRSLIPNVDEDGIELTFKFVSNEE